MQSEERLLFVFVMLELFCSLQTLISTEHLSTSDSGDHKKTAEVYNGTVERCHSLNLPLGRRASCAVHRSRLSLLEPVVQPPRDGCAQLGLAELRRTVPPPGPRCSISEST